MAVQRFKDANGNWIIVGGGGGGIGEVEYEMSDISDGAVANRVIKAYVDALISKEFDNSFNSSFTI